VTDAWRTEPIWLDATDALAIHDRQLSEHGGGTGVRDLTMLESALGRPVNQWHYGSDDPAMLAAAYAFGVARNHPFVDGNKRTAWVLARLFLMINGYEIAFDKEDAVRTVLALAAGHLSEDELADWFRTRLVGR
jgi:death on curing protein